MRLLFVIPPIAKKVLHGEWDLSAVDSISPPIGVLILTSILKEKGYDVNVIDAYAEPISIKELIEKIKDCSPDITAISFMTPAFNSALLLAQTIKEQLPKVYVVAGGSHVTAVPHETLTHQAFDFGVIGEGEITLIELLYAIENKDDLSKVKGIVFRNNHGQIMLTPPRDFIQNMDTLPFPDWRAVKLAQYRLSPIGTKGRFALPLITSRGCPCRCTFCDTGGVGPKIRGYSAEYVLHVIEDIVKNYGIREFVFYDDTFVALKKRVLEICEGIKKKNLKISWSCCARVDCVTRDMLEAMKSAGCWQIEYGIESGDQEILDKINKRISLEKVREAVKITNQIGIQTRGNFIFGLPGDTKETIEKTINFACSLELDYFQQGFLTPYPGSALYASAEKYGQFDKDWSKMNNTTINFVPTGMTKEELIMLSKKAFRRFYLRPKVIFSHLSWLIRNPNMIYNYSRAFGSYLKTILR